MIMFLAHKINPKSFLSKLWGSLHVSAQMKTQRNRRAHTPVRPYIVFCSFVFFIT